LQEILKNKTGSLLYKNLRSR